MPTPKPVFEMEDLSVRRGERNILKNIDWTVEPGQHWVLIGGNGSGKTSLLRVLMGYLTPTTGRVKMEDRDAAVDTKDKEWDDWRKRMGFVSSSIAEMIEPTERAIDVVMAGRHAMVNYWQRDKSKEADDAKAATRVLKKIECVHLAEQPWAFLSQGERQRILIGRALMTSNLKILILDEPCAGLDPVARENFLQFLQGLTEKGTFQSLVMVTHHVEEIIPNITHALVLRNGKIISRGDKRDALTSKSISQAFQGEITLRSRFSRYRIYQNDDDLRSGKIV